MGKKLVIRGDRTLGKEVIGTLEMLGGQNNKKFDGTSLGCGYYIENYGCINYNHLSTLDEDVVIFSIENFIDKYPHKVGDKVIHDGEVKKIIEARWSIYHETVVYTVEGMNGTIDCYDSKFIYPYKEEKQSEDTPIDYVKESNDRYRIVLNHQFDMVVDEGEYYAVKRSPYPKTYEECCSILPVLFTGVVKGYNSDKLYNFQKLLICYDAYRKVAGMKMKLGTAGDYDSWEPDWKNYTEYKYCIYISKDKIETGVFHHDNKILAFPSQEICDEFLKNFGYIIEECKELL